jgi:hypothetical protein
MSFIPRSTPHAFLVVSPTARLLTPQTPGIDQGFYPGASEPNTARTSHAVDLTRLPASTPDNPRAIDLLGPPPFAPAKVG